jgi:hypothetical protein
MASHLARPKIPRNQVHRSLSDSLVVIPGQRSIILMGYRWQTLFTDFGKILSFLQPQISGH